MTINQMTALYLALTKLEAHYFLTYQYQRSMGCNAHKEYISWQEIAMRKQNLQLQLAVYAHQEYTRIQALYEPVPEPTMEEQLDTMVHAWKFRNEKNWAQ